VNGNLIDHGDEEGTGFESGDVGRTEELSHMISQQIEAQIQAQMEKMTNQFNQEFDRISKRISGDDLSPKEPEQIMEKTRRTSGLETNLLQDKMHRAQEKLERRLEAAKRRHERRAKEFDRRTRHGKHSWSFELPVSTTFRPSPEREDASEEERFLILKMLEQKKITVDEAETLLGSLGGKVE